MSSTKGKFIVFGIILSLVLCITSILTLGLFSYILETTNNYTGTVCNVTATEIEQGIGLFGRSRVFIRVTFETSESETNEGRIIVGCGGTVGCGEVSERYPIGSEFICYWYPDLLSIEQKLQNNTVIITIIVMSGVVLFLGTCIGCCTTYIYRQFQKRILNPDTPEIIGCIIYIRP